MPNLNDVIFFQNTNQLCKFIKSIPTILKRPLFLAMGLAMLILVDHFGVPRATLFQYQHVFFKYLSQVFFMVLATSLFWTMFLNLSPSSTTPDFSQICLFLIVFLQLFTYAFQSQIFFKITHWFDLHMSFFYAMRVLHQVQMVSESKKRYNKYSFFMYFLKIILNYWFLFIYLFIFYGNQLT